MQIGAIGFCFGGLCVLDLARWNVGLRLAVSFHGVLTPIPDLALDEISTTVQVFHGDDDRVITEEHVSETVCTRCATPVRSGEPIHGGNAQTQD